MDARVGAAGHSETAPPGKDGIERLADDAFDGPLARLPRPAAEARAVVLERHLQGLLSHGRPV
jgi:hypothetical protein